MKDEPMPVSNHSPFAGGNFTPHPWIPQDTTITPVADSNCPGSASLEPNDRATFKEDE